MIDPNTPEKLHRAISDKISRGVPYIDAILWYANEYGVEIETIADVIKKSTTMREKIKEEATKKKMVKPDVNPTQQLCE